MQLNCTFSSMKLQLIKANNSHIEIINTLATEIWNKHYIEIISQAQINFMLEKMYSAQSLEQQIAESGTFFYLVEAEEKNIGFIGVSTTDNKNWQLNKFYLLNTTQGKGFGTTAFNLLLQELNSPQQIQLRVNRQNYKSVNFYFKNNFVIEKLDDLDLGEGYFMNDFVMRWQNKKP